MDCLFNLLSLHVFQVPGQRAIALQLIASILDKTLCKLQVQEARCKDGHAEPTDEFIDFEAVWAYALGPEPELVLSLRYIPNCLFVVKHRSTN